MIFPCLSLINLDGWFKYQKEAKLLVGMDGKTHF